MMQSVLSDFDAKDISLKKTHRNASIEQKEVLRVEIQPENRNMQNQPKSDDLGRSNLEKLKRNYERHLKLIRTGEGTEVKLAVMFTNSLRPILERKESEEE